MKNSTVPDQTPQADLNTILPKDTFSNATAHIWISYSLLERDYIGS